jgi:hypothetical protein
MCIDRQFNSLTILFDFSNLVASKTGFYTRTSYKYVFHVSNHLTQKVNVALGQTSE